MKFGFYYWFKNIPVRQIPVYIFSLLSTSLSPRPRFRYQIRRSKNEQVWIFDFSFRSMVISEAAWSLFWLPRILAVVGNTYSPLEGFSCWILLFDPNFVLFFSIDYANCSHLISGLVLWFRLFFCLFVFFSGVWFMGTKLKVIVVIHSIQFSVNLL